MADVESDSDTETESGISSLSSVSAANSDKSALKHILGDVYITDQQPSTATIMQHVETKVARNHH